MLYCFALLLLIERFLNLQDNSLHLLLSFFYLFVKAAFVNFS